MISIIAAMGNNREIGYQNKLLWNLPNDMQQFKEKTTGNLVLFGRKTFESIGKPLKNRTNIVLTTDIKLNLPLDVFSYSNVEDVLNEYYDFGEEKTNLFIAGGQQIYEQFLPYTDNAYITVVDEAFQADTYFPGFNDKWKMISKVDHKADNNHLYDYSFMEWINKNKLK